MATEILRPNGAGDYTNIEYQWPESGEHWDKVDEAVADDLTTRLFNSEEPLEKDAFTLGASSLTDENINGVAVYFRAYEGKITPGLRLGTDETMGTETADIPNTWTNFNETLSRPGGGNWSVADLADLQVIIGLNSQGIGGARVTQVYVVVDYSTSSTYEASVSDGLSMSDSNKGNLTIGLSLTDGLSGGDQTPAQLSAQNAVSDNSQLGDTLSTQASLQSLISDTIHGSDTPSTQAILQSLVSDGINLGDTLSHLYETNPSLSDGLSVGDVSSTIASLFNTLTDTVKTSDTNAIKLLINLILSDGVKGSDAPSTQATLQSVLSDGISLSDSVNVWQAFYDEISDGVSLGG